MEKRISSRQLAIILSISIVSLKFLIFPAIIAQNSQNNAYVTVFFSLLIDLVFFFLIIYIMKRNPSLTLFEILERGFGKIIAKIITLFLAAYFFLKLVVTIKEMHNYLYELLFESFSWFYFIVPTIVLIAYMSKIGVRGIGRGLEALYPILVILTIITVLLPIRSMQPDNILPFLPNGLSPILKSTLKTNFAFGDYFVLSVMFGKIKYDNRTSKKIIKYVLITDVFVVAFYMLFIFVFGGLAVNESLAVNDIPLYSNISSINGRLEWVSTIIWSINLIFQAGILMYCCNECVNYSFSFINKNINTLIISILLFMALNYFYLSLALALEFVLSKPIVIFTLSVQVAVPILLLISSLIGGRKNEKYNK